MTIGVQAMLEFFRILVYCVVLSAIYIAAPTGVPPAAATDHRPLNIYRVLQYKRPPWPSVVRAFEGHFKNKVATLDSTKSNEKYSARSPLGTALIDIC